MDIEHIINAWRDEEYRESLTSEQRTTLPESPIGTIDLSEDELAEVDGGTTSMPCITAVTALLCLSVLSGGTCQEQTIGCCGGGGGGGIGGGSPHPEQPPHVF